MPDKDWKRWERMVAHAVGGTRTGPLGSSVPDISGFDRLAIECKLQGRLALRHQDIQQATDNARGKPWALFLKEKKSNRRVVVMDYTDFILLLRGEI